MTPGLSVEKNNITRPDRPQGLLTSRTTRLFLVPRYSWVSHDSRRSCIWGNISTCEFALTGKNRNNVIDGLHVERRCV